MKKACLILLVLFSSCGVPRHNKGEKVTTSESKPLAQEVVIMVDGGHGGKDEGAHAKQPYYQEKKYNLTTAQYLKRYLNDMGYRVIMTRADDTFIPLNVRSSFANANEIDLFVSVHYNAAKSKKAQGIEVFYYKYDTPSVRSEKSKATAESVLKKLTKTTGAKGRGVKHGNLSVLRQTKMPAILVEGGFLTNDDERSKIDDRVYQQQIAWSIAQGIKEQFPQKP